MILTQLEEQKSEASEFLIIYFVCKLWKMLLENRNKSVFSVIKIIHYADLANEGNEYNLFHI